MFDLDILVNQLTTSGVCYELKCIKNIFVAKLTNVIYILKQDHTNYLF